MSNCPRCHGPLVRTTNMVPGAVVLGCKRCLQFTVEGCGRWVPGGAQLRESLVLLAGAVKADTDAFQVVMDTPLSDPRWEVISEFM